MPTPSRGVRSKNEHGLTERQERFIEAYATAKTNGEAAIKAGYSAKNARAIAFTVLQVPEVKRRIDEIRRRSMQMSEVTAQYITDMLKQIAESSVGENARAMDKKVAIEALKELNAMQGNHAPTKVETLNVSGTIEDILKAKQLYQKDI